MKTVLIVEDNALELESMVEHIRNAGFSVLTAKEGQMGLKTALSAHPDLILLDILMPKMDGITMMKQLRTDDWGKTVPIIINTNLDPGDKVIQEVIINKPSYYLMKSNQKLSDITDKIKEILLPVQKSI